MYYLFTNNISLIDFLKSYEKKGMGEISKFINNI
jgi:hypothetical protein